MSRTCYLAGRAPLCGEKKEKDLDFSSPLHLLDCLEGKKPHSFEEWDVSCTEAKTFFCI